MPYPQFDRAQLKLKPLAERANDLEASHWLKASEAPLPFSHPDLPVIAHRIRAARQRGRPVILMMGAHVIRAGVNAHIIDLMERGLLTTIAMNGACVIHDYELARIGATTESVARYIKTGEFGMWNETGEINELLNDLGFGESVGKHIQESRYPYKHLSILAAAYRQRVPATVHLGIGYDIIHQHPNFDPAKAGAASYRDFLIFTKTMEELEGGVLLAFGSAVMAPEIYLKALSMVRNAGHTVQKFTTAVFDLIKIDGDWHEQAEKSNPQYYYRPWKTILVRTVADGGESFYFCGDHRATVPALHHLLT